MSRPPARRVRTCAKINLHLAVGRRGRDGYHAVETLLQSIDWGDDLVLRTGLPGQVSLSVRGPAGVPGGEDNLVLRAARLWLAAGRRRGRTAPPGLHFELFKRLPPGAGLGGGSGDAAATLLLLEQAHAPRRREPPGPAALRRLSALARRLGADVPFFLRGGLARGTGRGDRVRALAPLPDWAVLVIVPPSRCPRPRSTPASTGTRARPSVGPIPGRCFARCAAGALPSSCGTISSRRSSPSIPSWRGRSAV